VYCPSCQRGVGAAASCPICSRGLIRCPIRDGGDRSALGRTASTYLATRPNSDPPVNGYQKADITRLVIRGRMKMANRILNVFVILLVVILVISCTPTQPPTPQATPIPMKLPIDSGELGRAANQAVTDWAKLHPTEAAKQFQSETPRILGSKVLSNDGSSARIVIFALFRETLSPITWTPRETIVELRSVSGNWTAQPIQNFDSPFVGTLLTADSPSATQCSSTIPEGARPSNGYPCVRLTNKGHFDWQWEKLHWGGSGQPGTGWGDGWAEEINLPSGGSVDRSLYSSWGEFKFKDIGLDDGENDMQVVLLTVQ
jgi:hypothetical protein